MRFRNHEVRYGEYTLVLYKGIRVLSHLFPVRKKLTAFVFETFVYTSLYIGLTRLANVKLIFSDYNALVKIQFYGAGHCVDCRASKQLLDEYKVPYDYIDLDAQPEYIDEVVTRSGGYQSTPLIIFPDESILVEPSDQVLLNKLRELNIIA